MSPTPIRVYLVSPALAMRVGLRALAKSPPVGSGFSVEVVGEASRLDEIFEQALDADILLTAGYAFTPDELESILNHCEGQIAFLLLADESGAAHAFLLRPVPAWGILPLDASAEELHAAFRAVREGLVVIHPTLSEGLLSRFASEERAAGARLQPLTDREKEVLQYLAQGMANKQIAAALGISEHTVKFHISSIYTKLNATNRTEAVRFGIQNGLIPL